MGSTALSSPKSLFISLYLNLVLKGFLGLINSSSLDCLINSSFVAFYKLPFWVIEPLPLILIDGTINQYVTQVVTLPIQLTYSYSCTLEFYMIYLDSSSPVVLEYSWLKSHNPNINWRRGVLDMSSDRIENLRKNIIDNTKEPRHESGAQLSISLINTAAY